MEGCFTKIEDMVKFLSLHPTWVWIEINMFKNGVGEYRICTLATKLEDVACIMTRYQCRLEDGAYVRDPVTKEIMMDNIDAWTVKCIDVDK